MLLNKCIGDLSLRVKGTGSRVNESERELADLVPRAAGGDRAAMQRIMVIIHPMAMSVGNYVDRGRPFLAFVYGIASNKVADAHRALSREMSNPTEDVPETALEHDTPEEYALVSDGSNRVRLLLDSLSEKAREVIILRVFVGLSAEETAEIVGSTPGAVRVAQHRALASLRKNLDGQER